MDSRESALVVLVAAAERLVRPFREAYDPAAAAGMPAHITVLYPFLAPDEIGPTVLDDLRQCFAGFAPFDFQLTELRRFPDVAYLAPEPAEPLRDLTTAIWTRFPETPPYEGRHPDIVPHLSVAQLLEEQQLDIVVQEIEHMSKRTLPIRTTANETVLMVKSAGAWRVHSRFPLGAGGS